MRKTLLALPFLLLILSCGTKQTDVKSIATEWNENQLNGSVKSTEVAIYSTDSTLIARNIDLIDRQKRTTNISQYNADNILDVISLYTYDDNGNCTQGVSVTINPDRSNDTFRTVNSYNDKGLLVKSEEFINNELVDYTEKKYNDQSLLTYTKQGDDSSESHFSYDQNGRLSEETRLYLKEVYSYDKNGNIASVKIFENGSDILLTTESYEYDKQGRLVKQTSRDTEGPSTLDYDKTYRYDDENRLIELRTEDKDERVERLITYKYDEFGNMVEAKKLFNHALSPETSTYSYDGQANWVEAVHTFDGGTYTIKRKIEYYEN